MDCFVTGVHCCDKVSQTTGITGQIVSSKQYVSRGIHMIVPLSQKNTNFLKVDRETIPPLNRLYVFYDCSENIFSCGVFQDTVKISYHAIRVWTRSWNSFLSHSYQNKVVGNLVKLIHLLAGDLPLKSKIYISEKV